MNTKEIQKDNWNRWMQEPEVFYTLLQDFNSINVKRIDIRGDRNDHQSDLIKNNQYYLCGEDGKWFISKAYKTGYGWVFNPGYLNTQLRNLDFLFEIDLPEIPKTPLGRIPIIDEAKWGDDEFYEEDYEFEDY
jgi:hypothetical protein